MHANILGTIFFMLIMNVLIAQPSTRGFDSIQLVKPKKSQALYTPDHTVIRELRFKRLKLKRNPANVGQILGETGTTLLTLFTSIGSGHSRKVNWLQTGEINTNDKSLDWEVQLYCQGELAKSKERVKNDDGSFSISTDKSAKLFWEKGGSGIIIEKNDTIARFLVTLSAQTDSIFFHHFKSFQLDTVSLSPPFRYFTDARASDYALKGNFRANDFEIIFDSDNWKAWIYQDNELIGMYQSDNDANRKRTNIPNNSVVPLLLYNKSREAGLQDLIRISILSRLVNDMVSTSSVEL
jgi:hypothetical protein